jgi:hypothetical protein
VFPLPFGERIDVRGRDFITSFISQASFLIKFHLIFSDFKLLYKRINELSWSV